MSLKPPPAFPNKCEEVVYDDDGTKYVVGPLLGADTRPWYQQLFDVQGCPHLGNPPPVLSDQCLAAAVRHIIKDDEKVSEFIVMRGDFMLKDAFLDYVDRQSPELLVISLVVVAIVIGCYGNGYLHFLFSRRKSAWYQGLDSCYFRELAALDLMVCLVVLPYSILYKLRFVTNDAACRTLEFVRHALTYAAHILLMTYIVEINRPAGNKKTPRFVSLTVVIVVFLSLVLAIPAAILFSVGVRETAVKRKLDQCVAHDVMDLLMCDTGPEEDNWQWLQYTTDFEGISNDDKLPRKTGLIFQDDNMEILFSPGYCHMYFGFTDDYVLVAATKAYLFINSALFVLAFGAFFWWIIPWIVTVSAADIERDIFYKFDSSDSEESEYSFDLTSMTKDIANDQTTTPSGTSDSSLSSDTSVTSDSSLSRDGQGDVDSKWVKMQGLMKGKRSERIERMAVWPLSKNPVSQVFDKSPVTKTENKVTFKSEEESLTNDESEIVKPKNKWWKNLTIPITKKSKRRQRHNTISADISLSSEETSEETATLSDVETETTDSYTDTSTDEDKAKQELLTEPFKVQYIGFMLLDLLVVATVGVFYMMDTRTADVMILIHIKSVISLYFFVVFHHQLRERVCPWLVPCIMGCVSPCMGCVHRLCPCLWKKIKAATTLDEENGKENIEMERTSGSESESVHETDVEPIKSSSPTIANPSTMSSRFWNVISRLPTLSGTTVDPPMASEVSKSSATSGGAPTKSSTTQNPSSKQKKVSVSASRPGDD